MTLQDVRENKIVDKGSKQDVISFALEMVKRGYPIGWVANAIEERFGLGHQEAYSVAEDSAKRIG